MKKLLVIISIVNSLMKTCMAERNRGSYTILCVYIVTLPQFFAAVLFMTESRPIVLTFHDWNSQILLQSYRDLIASQSSSSHVLQSPSLSISLK